MVRVKNFIDLSTEEKLKLSQFLKCNEEKISLYHLPEFANVIKDSFGYRNLSLVILDDSHNVLGYLPQWQKANIIESIPWRDRGGPVCLNEDVLATFVDRTKQLVGELKLNGFIWKRFKTPLLDNYKYFSNVRIDLSKYTAQSYWDMVPSKVRSKIRVAKRNGLVFESGNRDTARALKHFYKLFVINRKRLGVPVYPFRLFESYFRNMPKDSIDIFNVFKGNRPVSSLLLLYNRYLAIDAYSASDGLGLKLKANDFMIHNVINYCLENKIRFFDFGADSPLQRSLIDYKLKWLGQEEQTFTSFFGDAKEIEHNLPKYNLAKKIIQKMPTLIYSAFSKVLVR